MPAKGRRRRGVGVPFLVWVDEVAATLLNDHGMPRPVTARTLKKLREIGRRRLDERQERYRRLLMGSEGAAIPIREAKVVAFRRPGEAAEPADP